MHSFATLSLALLTSGLVAQPTLQIADFPTSALTLNWYTLTAAGNVTDPSNGTGQTWDWTSASWALSGIVTIAPAAGSPYAAQFPAANYVYITTPTGGSPIYAYLLVDASGIQVICGDAPSNTEVYTNYKTILETPFSFGAAFSDTNDGTQGPGAETWTYTGAGTLLTNYGNFGNTVKMSRTADNRTALWNSVPLFPRITGNSQAVNLFTDPNTSIGELGVPVIPLTVFPTASSDNLTIEAVGAGSRWTISDIQGRLFQNGSFTQQGDQRLDIAGLATGTYILSVTDDSGTRSAHFQKL